MKKRAFTVIVMLVLVATVSGSFAADSAPKGAEILKVIPAGSSYIAVNDVAKTFDNVEKFLVDIGVGPMLGLGAGGSADGRKAPSVLLKMFKANAKLGDGFNANGGAAFVILDPSSVGVDLFKASDSVKPDDVEKIFVGLLPGKIEGLLADRKLTTDGKFSVLTVGGDKLYARQAGPYVIYGKMKKPVQALMDAKKFAIGELSKDELKLVAGSNLIARYNSAPYKKIMLKGLDEFEKTFKKELGPMAPVAGVYATIGRGMISQVDSLTVGVRLTNAGVNVDSITATRVGSTAAGILQTESGKSGGAKVLDSVPSMPYVFALGMKGWIDNKALNAELLDFSQKIVGAGAMGDVDKKTQAKIKAHQAKMADMITGFQLVIGGAPQGKGMVAMDYLIRCKDSAKYMKASRENLALNAAVMKKGNPMLGGMNYVAQAETIDGLSVDAVDITMANAFFGAADMARGFKMALGEEKIRMRLAAPDSKTMLITIGGVKTFLRESVRVAFGGGPIPKMPGTITAMKQLPKDSTIVSLFNVTNLLDAIRTGMLVAEAPPQAAAMVPAMKCQTPIAFGAKAKGTELHTGLFVPKDIVKEGVTAVMTTIARIEQQKREMMRQIQGEMEDEGPGPIDAGDL